MRSERVSEHGRHRDINLTWREQHHDVSGGREGAPDVRRSGLMIGASMVGRRTCNRHQIQEEWTSFHISILVRTHLNDRGG